MDALRFKIRHVMIAAAGVALTLAYVRDSSSSDAAIGRALSLVALVSSVGLMVGPLLFPHPLREALSRPPEDPEERIGAIEAGLASTRPVSLDLLVKGRCTLMELHRERGRLDDAIAQGRAILDATAGQPHEIKPQVHDALADCHAAAGREREAEAERQAAVACLEEESADMQAWLARGRRLSERGDHAGAAAAYERALELASDGEGGRRPEILMLLALASFHQGRLSETARWAERLIEENESDHGPHRPQAHRLAGRAYLRLGRLDEAGRHYRRAGDLDPHADPRRASEDLASLADLERLKGNLDAAEALCRKAESIGPAPGRLALATSGTVLTVRGRFAEALERLEQAGRVGIDPFEAVEARQQAFLSREKAFCLAELGRAEEAEALLLAAREAQPDDPPFVLICDAGLAWVLGLRGDRRAVRQRDEQLPARLDPLNDDVTLRLGLLEALGRALLDAGEAEQAQRRWEEFLAINPFPLHRPLGLYFLGECRRLRGDTAAARLAYEQAVGCGIASHPARLAAERLGALS